MNEKGFLRCPDFMKSHVGIYDGLIKVFKQHTIGRCVLGALLATAVGGLWNQWHETKVYLKTAGLLPAKTYDLPHKIKLAVGE
ncbi:hypothetical protein NKH10_03280 [Mesorhizobium sp. M1340]|uniref:hypothetical protein n=1 Tax=Mesorhizobium sp. M1340 TaxID=2957087 RepID=UPI00333D14C4